MIRHNKFVGKTRMTGMHPSLTNDLSLRQNPNWQHVLADKLTAPRSTKLAGRKINGPRHQDPLLRQLENGVCEWLNRIKFLLVSVTQFLFYQLQPTTAHNLV